MLKTSFFCFFLSITAVYCQNSPFPKYTELSKFEGDFDGDGAQDKVVVYEKKCVPPDGLENTQCRRVAIFLKKGGKYVLHSYNDKIIECSDCGGAGVGDPFQGIKVKKQYFSVELLFGAAEKTFTVTTFKYDKKSKDFFLYKIGTEDYSFDRDSEAFALKTTTSFQTSKDFGKVTFRKYLSD